MEWGRYCFTDFKKITICRGGSLDHSVALQISVMSGLLFVCVLLTGDLSSSWTLHPWYAYEIILFDLYQKHVECLRQHRRDNHQTSQRLGDFSLDIRRKESLVFCLSCVSSCLSEITELPGSKKNFAVLHYVMLSSTPEQGRSTEGGEGGATLKKNKRERDGGAK